MTWLPLFFFSSGITAGLLAVIARLVERHAQASWRRTTGEVIGVERQKAPSSRTSYSHTVRFTTDTGEVIDLPPVSARFPHYKTGQAARVLFDPLDPRRAIVDEPGWRWGKPVWWLIAAAFAMVFLGAAIWR